jgi:hypothetical protein
MAGSENQASPPTDGPGVRESHDYAAWANVLCGLSVFALRYLAPRGTFSVHWNLFLTGIVIMFAALATTISHGNTTTNYWSAINVAAGAWLLISTRAIPSTPVVNSVELALGGLIIVLAVVSLIVEAAAQKNRPVSEAPNR